ncbi:MAG TPA: aspartyl protease family protein [Verrucomicrobiae bacterium]|nr:aspartyl protease family protein [Verrucomicrobiae bacterium]
MKQAPKWLLILAMWAAPSFAQQTNSAPITVKARMAHNRFVLPAKINETSLSFLLDSACTIPTLHPEVVEELKLESSGSVRIAGIAGEESAPTYRGIVIDMGEAKYSPRRIASIPSERSESRRRRDGVIGSGFFRQFVVEMDARAKEIRLHSPTNYTYTGRGEVIPFRFRRGDEIPIVEASIVVSNQPIKAEFEVDTGCDSGLCLGAKFVNENKLLEAVQSRSSEKFGIGGSVETKSGAVPILRLGKLDIDKPQTDFFHEGSPVDEPLVGHIGMGVFHRYKVILDYARKQMILEPYE